MLGSRADFVGTQRGAWDYESDDTSEQPQQQNNDFQQKFMNELLSDTDTTNLTYGE